MKLRTTWWRRAITAVHALTAGPSSRGDRAGAKPSVRARAAQVEGLVLAIILLVALGLLAGCSTQPQIQTVKVAIPVECREATPARPAMPTQALPPEADLDAKVAALLAEIELLEGYEGLLLAALAACQRPVVPAP